VIRRSAQSLRTESSRGCINNSSLDFAFIGHGAQKIISALMTIFVVVDESNHDYIDSDPEGVDDNK
jgi:hypothetical protein